MTTASPPPILNHRWLRAGVIAAIVLTAVLVPFAIAGDRLDVWSLSIVRASASRPALVAATIVVLLAADVLLPIPSSIVSTMSGVFLGFSGGLAASAIGMTIGGVAAYWLGRSAAPRARAFVGASDAQWLDRAFRRYGDWLIVMTRPVPVLAEATPVFAGMGQMPFARFFVLAGVANVGVSAVYAFVGAYAAETRSFLLAFAGAVLVPLGPMLWLRRRDRAESD